MCRDVHGRGPWEPDPAPAIELRLLLACLRAAGATFPAAWLTAVEVACEELQGYERQSWLLVFSQTRDSWRRAYAKVGPRAKLDASLLVL
jgi:hypothetical protein